MHTSVLCVAPQEAQAVALVDAVTHIPDVFIAGLCDPNQVQEVMRLVGATLILTPEGTVIPDVEKLGILVLPVPEVDKAAKVLTAP